MSTSRRRFLAFLPGATALAALAAAPTRLNAWLRTDHPDPRPDVTADGVLTHEQLGDISAEIIELYDGIREMPHIADGIGCTCGCALLPGYRSLLTCYEANGMAQGCLICQGTARIAHRRWKEGQSLERIRAALDARFG